MNRHGDSAGMPRPDQHMVTTLDPVQAEPESLQGSNGVLAGDRRFGSHQPAPTMRLSSVSFEAARGILRRFASIDLM